MQMRKEKKKNRKPKQFCPQSYLTSLSYPKLYLKQGLTHIAATTNSL